ncbi:hypothetical protein STCU_02564 [Strigomonas culicis]|uniref:Uncharacterized protein n=1 Tax=Strigomonas culicis TaxID=28005 RepID=S9UVX8_9TRYP|nr:hypothetical protein STCU_02564 [Strigomonas culicis]|eukprot:EPY32949.1 hypothetical protein STCU_02564 [Strigomonas culicis]
MMRPCRFAASRVAPCGSALAALSRGVSNGVCHPTPVWRRTYKKMSANDIVDMIGTESHTQAGSSPLALNLFEDPTGGLVSGPAEELTTAELESQIQVRLLRYSKETFYLLYSSFVDVVFILIEHKLTPVVQDEEKLMDARALASEVTKWFLNGAATVKNPSYTAEGMGEERWRRFSAALVAHGEGMEEVLPLTRAVRKHQLPEEVFVPFLRQLAMDLVDGDQRREVLQLLPGLTLSLANGRAPALLELPQEQAARAAVVAELFLSCGQETGNAELAYLGVQLLRANDMPTPFSFQKQLTNVFSAAARIRNDWQMRGTGQLIDTYPKWLEYHKRVRLDNMKALKRIEAEAAAAEQTERRDRRTVELSRAAGHKDGLRLSTAGGPAKGMHHYFSSRREEEVEHVRALQRNIDRYMVERHERLRRAQGAVADGAAEEVEATHQKETSSAHESEEASQQEKGMKKKKSAKRGGATTEKKKSSRSKAASKKETVSDDEEGGDMVFLL